ncbi:MAG: 3-isopropylmalate dehydratase small subunit [Thermoproteota archaeon]|nr:3-isopropylmalate dehydratase small subunit [Thermoproteota archaeon]
MEPIRIIKSKAIPLDMVNVDTDQIIPKQFLKLIHKTGYGKYLFYDWRFNSDGELREDFVLNHPKYNRRQILLARDNFGSGSSREHAAWALRDYGFKAIIAPTFADIFYSNCFKNGILPVRLPHQELNYLFQNVDDIELEINLPEQKITIMNSKNPRVVSFEVEGSKKKILLNGLDEIGITLQLDRYIAEYERRNPIRVLADTANEDL